MSSREQETDTKGREGKEEGGEQERKEWREKGQDARPALLLPTYSRANDRIVNDVYDDVNMV